MSSAAVPLFDLPYYQAITRARLDHLATLELPVGGRSVIDVGAGIGRLSEFFVEQGCDVMCVDGRDENIELLRQSYPDRRAAVVDVESDDLLAHGRFDVVFCYGLLYHLADPFQFLVGDPEDPTMALATIASRPSPSYVAAALRSSGFDHLYSPVELPDHRDFRYRRLNDLSYWRDGAALRDIFVSSRVPLDNPRLRALPREPLPLEWE